MQQPCPPVEAREICLQEGHLPSPGQKWNVGNKSCRELPRKWQHPPADVTMLSPETALEIYRDDACIKV